MNDKKESGIIIKKKHIIIAVIIIILLLLCAVKCGASFGKKPDGDSSSQSEEISDNSNPSLDIDPNAGQWTGQKPEDKGGEAVGIKIPGYPSITIAKDTKNVVMALLNPEGNPCYFKFAIVLKDTNETIYESKYVPPGDAITNVNLTRPLAEGEYNATIKISTIALDQETEMNGANVETVIIAK